MANLKTIKEEKKKKKKGDVAYTPLTEAQKEKERKKLIEDLKKGKKGLYHTPGAPRWSVEKKKKKKTKTT